jgi:hypothetical protein
MKLSIFLFLLFIFVITLGYAEDTDPYLIVPGVRVGPITAKTIELDLVELYGVENVHSTVSLSGQSETTTETILFPFDTMKKLQIIWVNGNSHEGPALVRISGTRSLWHTEDGISLGTSLIRLEIMNGTFFHLTGFNFDNPGVITDCGYGKLKYLGYLTPGEETIRGKFVTLSLDQPNYVYDRVTKEEYATIVKDGIFRSDNSVMERLNPVVRQIEMTFKK